MSRFCTKCGSEISPGSKFCNECGNPVEMPDDRTNADFSSQPYANGAFAENPATMSGNAVTSDQDGSGISKITLAVMAAVLLIACSLGSYFFFSRWFAKGADIPAISDVDSVPVSQATMLRDMATIIARGEVNVRANPTTNSASVGVVREGDQVEVLEKGMCNDSYSAIIVSDDIYYYDGGRRTILGKGKPVQIISEGYGTYTVSFVVNGRTVTVNGNSSYFRKLYGTIWYRINGNGYTGWILSEYARMN